MDEEKAAQHTQLAQGPFLPVSWQYHDAPDLKLDEKGVLTLTMTRDCLAAAYMGKLVVEDKNVDTESKIYSPKEVKVGCIITV